MRAKVIVSSLLLIILTIIVAIIIVIYKDMREEKKVKTIINSFKVDLTSIIKMNNHKITDDYTTFSTTNSLVMSVLLTVPINFL